jgi:hypothetical protein
LYSAEANQKVERESAGADSEAILYSRPPFYAWLLRPLAALPYLKAYYVFQAISAGCFFAFLWLFVPQCRELAAFASISIPLFANVQNGQDATIVTLLAGVSLVLARRNLDFLAGFVLSLCAIKFHLFALVPVAIVLQRRWWILAGGAAGGAVLVALSALAGGPDWAQAYLGRLQDSRIHPGAEHMPNLHGFSVLFGGGGFAFEAALILATVLAVGYLAVKLHDYDLVFAFAIIGSLLISFHSYVQDALVLLIPLAILLRSSFERRVRELMELACSPIPYFLLLAGAPLNVFMPALLLAILAVAAIAARQTAGVTELTAATA